MQKFGRRGDPAVMQMMRLIILCALALLIPVAVPAEGNPAVASIRTYLSTTAVQAGTQAKIAIVVQVAPGYHVNDHKPSLDYLIPTEITIHAAPSWTVEKVIYPHGQPKKFAFLDTPISVYAGETRFEVKLRASRSLRPGTYKLRGDFAYQACNNTSCLAPTQAPFEIVIPIVESSGSVKPANSRIFEHLSLP